MAFIISDPDRPLPPRSACLGFPPRHVCAAERCLLLTYLLEKRKAGASEAPRCCGTINLSGALCFPTFTNAIVPIDCTIERKSTHILLHRRRFELHHVGRQEGCRCHQRLFAGRVGEKERCVGEYAVLADCTARDGARVSHGEDNRHQHARHKCTWHKTLHESISSKPPIAAPWLLFLPGKQAHFLVI